MDLSLLVVISLTAAEISGGDRHCPVSCSVMLTSDWSWRGNILYIINVMLWRGEGEKKRENHCANQLCRVLSSVRVDLKSTHPWCVMLFASIHLMY